LGQQLSVLLYSGHMSCKYLFLFLQNVRNLFLKGKKLILILVPHCSFHSINVILYFLFFFLFLFLFFFNLNLLINCVLLLFLAIHVGWVFLSWGKTTFFNWVRTIFLSIFCFNFSLLFFGANIWIVAVIAFWRRWIFWAIFWLYRLFIILICILAGVLIGVFGLLFFSFLFFIFFFFMLFLFSLLSFSLFFFNMFSRLNFMYILLGYFLFSL